MRGVRGGIDSSLIPWVARKKSEVFKECNSMLFSSVLKISLKPRPTEKSLAKTGIFLEGIEYLVTRYNSKITSLKR